MAEIPPPNAPAWLQSYRAGEKRRPGFQPGRSGNPAGRPKGSKNKRSLVAAEFEKAGSDVARVCLAKALEGDAACLSLVLTRIEPPLRPRAKTVEFELDPSQPLAAQAQQVLVAVAEGKVDPDTGKMLCDLIASFAGIRQVDDLQARIERLEKNV